MTNPDDFLLHENLINTLPTKSMPHIFNDGKL